MHSLYLSLLLLTTAVYATEKVRYDGYRLFKVIPNDTAKLKILNDMKEYGSGFNVWGGPRLNLPSDIMVAPNKLPEFEEKMKLNGMDTELLMDDVQRYIEMENPLSNLRGTFDWKAYHDLGTINTWLDLLVEKYPKLLSPLVGGQSYEGREIRGVRLSSKEGNPGIFIEGGIHAREWISPAVITYILNQLLTSEDPAVIHLRESYDWYIFPVFNPDGYEFTHRTNRFWRKTRKPYTAACRGADPNRNWNFHWNDGGTNPNPCSETFPGDAPFSEIETRTMSEFIEKIHDKIFAYVAFHSYSQLLLIPYGHSNDKISNYDDLFSIGNASINALSKRYGTKYKVGNIVDVIYVASGGSMDWVRGTYNTPISYTYELRDTGRYGFLLPADQIIPTAEETFDSVVTMFQEAKKKGYGTLTDSVVQTVT